jgi:hypothetical protein
MNRHKKIPKIDNLHAEKSVKQQSKDEIFTIVLNKCIDQILETNARTEHTFTYFEVPNIIIGFPGYDRLACIHFLIHQLRQKGYTVEFIEPIYLYIDWGQNFTQSKQTKSNNIIDNISFENIIHTSNPGRLKEQTKALLKKYPNTSKIVFELKDNKKKKK